VQLQVELRSPFELELAFQFLLQRRWYVQE